MTKNILVLVIARINHDHSRTLLSTAVMYVCLFPFPSPRAKLAGMVNISLIYKCVLSSSISKVSCVQCVCCVCVQLRIENFI